MQPSCDYEEGTLDMVIKGCAWIIVARERLRWNVLYSTNPPQKKLSTPWGFVPHCHFLFLLKHRGNITRTPHAAWQKTDSHFEYQTFWDTHITDAVFLLVCQKWGIEATHCFSLLPHLSVLNFTALLIKLSHIYIYIYIFCCCHQLKKRATGRMRQNNSF